MKATVLFIFALFCAFGTWAQEAVSATVELAQVIPAGDFLQDFIQFLFSAKGASSLAIAYGVVQLAIKFLKSELCYKVFKKLTPAVQMSAVQGLTILATLLTSMLSGQTFVTALLSGAVLIPLQEYLFQAYKKYLEKKA